MNEIKNELIKKRALLEEYKKRKKEKEQQKQISEANKANNFENLNADEILLRCGVVQSAYPSPSSSSMSLISYSSSANSLNNLAHTSKSKNRSNSQIDQEALNKKIEKLNLKPEIDLNKVDILPIEKILYAKETQTQLSLFDDSSHNDDPDNLDQSPNKQNTKKKKKSKPAPIAFYDDVFVYDTFQWEDEFMPFDSSNQNHKSPSHTNNQKNGKFYLENQDSDNYDDYDSHDRESDPNKSHDDKQETSRRIDYDDFLSFMVQKRPVVERALRQNESNIFVDYTASTLDQNKDQDENITKIELKKTFNLQDKVSKHPIITCLDWSLQYSELLLCAYNNISFDFEEANTEAIVALWNAKSDQKLPQQTFNSTSLVTSCIFSPYHPSLIVASTYTGQIVMWDIRSNKRTPIQRSSLSISSHVNPVYCVKILQNQSIVSISNDGKLCTWSLENLNTPIDSLDLLVKQPANRPIYATCLDFQNLSQTDDQIQNTSGLQRNAIIGAEDGLCHSLATNNKFGLNQTFESHFGPITSVNCFTQCSHEFNSQPISVNDQLSKLFLSSSFDSTVKLWNMDDETTPVFTFESNGDYVYDVGWSPIHPALFASVDGSGRLAFWNLNKEVEIPTSSVDVDNRTRALNKLKWSRKGTEIAVGDDQGEMRIYELSENFARPSNDEYENLLITLDNLKNLNQESINFNLNINSSSDINYLIESFR